MRDEAPPPAGLVLRLARPDDAAAIREIYAYYVLKTAITFEEEVPPVDEMRRRLETVLPDLPWLVAETDGKIEAYAYAIPYRARHAYRWTVETTIYVDNGARSRGIGRRLYGLLVDTLKRQGYRTLLAGIALPNPASVRLHEALGYRPSGALPKVGFKHRAWHDVGWWALHLLPEEGTAPAEPTPLGELMQRGELPELAPSSS